MNTRRRVTWLVRMVLLAHLTGLLMVILAGAMIPAALMGLADGAGDAAGLFSAAGASASLGALLFIFTRGAAREVPLGHREGLLIVGTAWLMAGIVGALPYYLFAHLSPDGICSISIDYWGKRPIGWEFCSFTDSAFESISGFTTTGASVITDGLWGDYGLATDGRPGFPRGILLWRSITHFLGGMGIVVLGVAILPLLGVGGMELFKAEVPGPTTDKLAPRVTTTARLLWEVYLILSLVLFVLLAAGGMDAFEAVCHSMSTMASGGFSTRATSMAGFHSPYLEWVNTIFMLLAGMNFTLHWRARGGNLRVYGKDPEFRIYAFVVIAAVGIVTMALLRTDRGYDFLEGFRLAAFQVASIITTTGYASTDFETWTDAPAALYTIVLLLFVGGMAGSTGGGIKVVRHVLMIKLWMRELFMLSHPRAVRPVRLAGKPVPPEILRAAVAFVGVYVMLVLLGTGWFALEGHDVLSAFTISATTLGNVGPGLGSVGPLDNFQGLSVAGKWVASMLMVLGRLEIYTLLVLLTPSFWRR